METNHRPERREHFNAFHAIGLMTFTVSIEGAKLEDQVLLTAIRTADAGSPWLDAEQDRQNLYCCPAVRIESDVGVAYVVRIRHDTTWEQKMLCAYQRYLDNLAFILARAGLAPVDRVYSRMVVLNERAGFVGESGERIDSNTDGLYSTQLDLKILACATAY